MANDKRFIVKNGLQTPNVSFKDSNESLNEITVEMLGTDTLSFSGDAGQLFSLTDTLSGTIFSVNDISGIPSIEVDDDGEIRLAEFVGNVSIGTDSSRGFNVYVDGTLRADSADIAIVNGTATNADNVKITNDTSTNSTHYVHFGSATTGNDGVQVSSSKLTFNPSTGLITSDAFSGNITSSNVDISGGSIDGTTIGSTTTSTGAFTTISASGAITASGGVTVSYTHLTLPTN